MILNNKNRNPWIAGIFTFFTIGLGHLYAGYSKRGIFLFSVGQLALMTVTLLMIYYYPNAFVLLMVITFVVGYYGYCIIDAVILAKQKRYGYKLKNYNKWYVYLGCWVFATLVINPVVGATIKSLYVQAYKIPAGSLEPTILVGDHILAKKWFEVRKGINRGDMIIFSYPKNKSIDYIKRVIASGGDTIELRNKEVIINGKTIEEPYVIHTDPNIIPMEIAPRDNYGPVTVPENSFFVMGDNRDNSNDSRFWGYLDRESVKGKAYSIYWSWDKDQYRVRWSRIGKRIQ